MLSKILPLAVALLLVLAACGGSDDSDASSSGDDQMSEEAMSEDAMPDETMSDDEEMAEDSMTDESMSDDEEMAEESMSDDAMSDDAMDEHMPTSFTVTVTNSSDTGDLPTPLAPGAYAVLTSMDTLFAEGQADRGEGLEQLAEDGDPSALVASLDAEPTVAIAGAFTNPDQESESGPALPGSAYSFSFEAMPGDYLTLATMFVQSNDWFFAPASSGINLFEGGEPIAGDISDLISLWDAGTEVDETPGEGANQAPRQAGPDTGEAQGAPVTAVSGYEGAVTVTISING